MPTGLAQGGAVSRSASSFTLRARLTVWSVAIFSVIQFASLGVLWLYQRSAIDSMANDLLLNRARALAVAMRERLPAITHAEIEAWVDDELRFTPWQNCVADVLDGAGRSIVAGTHAPVSWTGLRLDAPPPAAKPVSMRLRVPQIQARANSNEPARVVALGVASEDGVRYSLVLAAFDAWSPPRLVLVTQTALIAAIISAVAAMTSAWFVAGIAIAPLKRVRGLAERLDPMSISHEIIQDSRTPEVARLNEELERARLRIQQAFIAQERFLSNVSHEIKTPIAVLLIEAQTVDRTGCPPAIASFITSAEEEMSRMGELVESFLTLTRIQDGKGLVRMKPYAVNDLVVDSLQNCSMMAGQYRVRLCPVLLDAESTLDTRVEGEPNLLRTMLENLVRNAIRFSPEFGAVEVSIKVSEKTASIVVRDHGPGIPPDRLHMIFDRFSTADPGERHGRGHGLGLSISLGIAELHGGAITVANLPAGGCEFTIVLPLPGSRMESAAVRTG